MGTTIALDKVFIPSAVARAIYADLRVAGDADYDDLTPADRRELVGLAMSLDDDDPYIEAAEYRLDPASLGL